MMWGLIPSSKRGSFKLQRGCLNCARRRVGIYLSNGEGGGELWGKRRPFQAKEQHVESRAMSARCMQWAGA